MTYDEWWASYIKPASIYTLKETTEDAWDAGVQEGLRRNRKWVGLTHNGRIGISHDYRNYDDVIGDWFDRDGFALAIEDTLKRKNT